MTLGDRTVETADYWTKEEQELDISVKEAFVESFFAQDLSSGVPFLEYPYVFPPLSLMGPVLRFLKFHGRSCTVIALDVYPRKYW